MYMYIYICTCSQYDTRTSSVFKLVMWSTACIECFDLCYFISIPLSSVDTLIIYILRDAYVRTPTNIKKEQIQEI